MKISRLHKFILLNVLLSSSLTVLSQLRVEPPSWWTHMADPSLQLLVHGEGIARAAVLIDKPGIFLRQVVNTDNANYLFIDLEVAPDAEPGTYGLVFEYQREVLATYDFELQERRPGSRERQGFGPQDVIYLAMPDRFANGDPDNDDVEEMLEKADRSIPNGRHGGDLEGVIDRLDYLEELGVTALWLNPVLENNMPEYSYHGYAITDFYRVDPRLGGTGAYLELVDAAHQKGMKVIMDMVFNHCGDRHWWMSDPPMPDWVHTYPGFTRSNFRAETIMDPYASEYDRTRMQTGWFDVHMPDLNQKNPYLANYLIQNSIWWIEQASLDGIRMDTYPYSDKAFMVSWIQRVRTEYPNFNVVGETWMQKEAHTAYFQDEARNKDGYDSDLPTVTDFSMHYALTKAFNEDDDWTTGLARLYYVLSQDFLYPDPSRTLVFADNHDLTRYFTSVGGDLDQWKMAMAFLLTTRGIPMIYYGTEFLMAGEESAGHGFIRQDFPLFGNEQLESWTVGQLDRVRYEVVSSLSSAVSQSEEANIQQSGGEQQYNNITIEQLNHNQIEAYNYLRQLLNFRKDEPVLHHGMLKQFVPQDGIYVYFRYDEKKTIMVVMNNNRVEKSFGWERFAEATEGYTQAVNVMDGTEVVIGLEFKLAPRTARIYELEK